MGAANTATWSIVSIQCSGWRETNDFANIEISNYSGDYIDFQVVRTPDADIVPFNVQSVFASADWYQFTSEQDAISSQVDEIQARLETWQKEIDIVKTWVDPKKWAVRRGQAVDEVVWAGLAYLFELRASMLEPRIVEALAADMNIDAVRAKERIRKMRDKEFLSLVGKGKNTQAIATNKAIRILENQELLK